MASPPQQQQQQLAALCVARESGDAAPRPLLRGKRVLLVEPCAVVRQVLALALRAWGCCVCATRGEAQALLALVSGGSLRLAPACAAALEAEAAALSTTTTAAAGGAGAPGVSSSLQGSGSSSSSSNRRHLQLRDACEAPLVVADGCGGLTAAAMCKEGPFDCVILDTQHAR